LTIGIVAYNALDKLRACLDSVAAQVLARPLQVVVVDNASAEPVADTLRADYPWVTLVASARNLGFAGGSNLALAQAQHPLLLLLNPDTVLPAPDTLERLAARFEAHPELGALGCRLELPDGATQIIAGRVPRAREVALDLFHRGQPVVAPPLGAELVDAEYLSGAALLTSREVWQAVGPLDEGYFMYFEDTDWCVRARGLGYRLAAAPDITIVHHEGASYGGRSFARREHFWRALVRFCHRHDTRASLALLRVALAVSAALKLPLALVADRSADRAARLSLLRAQLRLGLRGA
jgi:GT2 family glycosyltransferase